jgi:hypothetical protein
MVALPRSLPVSLGRATAGGQGSPSASGFSSYRIPTAGSATGSSTHRSSDESHLNFEPGPPALRLAPDAWVLLLAPGGCLLHSRP